MLDNRIAYEDGKNADPREIEGYRASDDWTRRELAAALEEAEFEVEMLSGYLEGLYGYLQSDFCLPGAADEQQQEAWLTTTVAVRGAYEIVYGVMLLLASSNQYMMKEKRREGLAQGPQA